MTLNNTIYQSIIKAKQEGNKLLAILIDPDKIQLNNITILAEKINQSPATHIFVGGSLVENQIIDELICQLKILLTLPILIFPGNPSQISNKADGILFLNLISGRNPDYLIQHQVDAVPILIKAQLEIISTAYILVDGGVQTAVERVSKTKPMDRNNVDYVLQTALAGTFMGAKLIYLEAGSGAKYMIPMEMIQKIAQYVSIPIIVGGGITSQKSIQNAYKMGADMVVIGTAFENDINFFNP